MSIQFFIVGMPRSGTKLLREILNGHSIILVPKIETEFLPYWEKHWSTWGGKDLLSLYNNFEKFYKKTINLPYFLYMNNKNSLIEPEIWFKNCVDYSIAGVFEGLLRHDTKAKKFDVLGDKSPSYILHIPLLKKLFPEAKIIHIIRDVRDYCLSINKAWGKNMLRAAQRWSDNVIQAKKDALKFEDDYFELKYEELLENPEKKIEQLCLFLNVKYQNSMLNFKEFTENIGDTKEMLRIVKTNKDKFKTNMNPKQKKRIEQIAFSELIQLGYPCENYIKNKRLSTFEEKLYQIFDGIQLIKYRRKNSNNSIFSSMFFYLYAYKQTRF